MDQQRIDTAGAVPVAPVIPAPKPEPTGYLSTEPVKAAKNTVQAATIVSAGAIILGADLSAQEQWAYGVAATLLLIVFQFLGEWLRANVTPVKRAESLIDQAYVAQPEAGGANKPSLPTG